MCLILDEGSKPFDFLQDRAPCPRLSPQGTEARTPSLERFRIFHCKLCGKAVRICSLCDRGQRYCSRGCSKQARRLSCRKAGRKYQNGSEGREGNARRQREFYWRQWHKERSAPAVPPNPDETAGNLTHQASAPSTKSVRSSHQATDLAWRLFGERIARRSPQRCHFCGRPCGAEATIL